jgi:transposase-like protein
VTSSNGTIILSATEPEPTPPNPEVVEHARRRQFTAAYKVRILQEADACAPGQLGALLRREGLYSSHLTHWRQQRDRGLLAALAPGRRGRPARAAGEQELARLRQENERLTQKLAAAETVIDIQKSLGALGLTAPTAKQLPPDGAARRLPPRGCSMHVATAVSPPVSIGRAPNRRAHCA